MSEPRKQEPIPNFTLHTRVARAAGQVSCDVAGEAAILNIKSGTYFGLNPVGSRIWSLIEQPRSVTELRDQVVREYDVDPARCEQDIFKLLNDLATAGLIRIIPS